VQVLRKSWQFRKVYEQGERLGADRIVVFYLRGCPDRQIGVVAGRKVGKAVARNRAKRLLREAARALEQRLPEDVWLVLVARKGAEKAKFSDILAELVGSLGGAGLVSGDKLWPHSES